MRSAALFSVALAAATPEFSATSAAGDDAFLRAYRSTIVTRDVRISQCAAVDALDGLADATIDVNAHVPVPAVDKQGRYYGRTIFVIRQVTLRLPRSVTGEPVRPGRALLNTGDGNLVTVTVPSG